jgi:hypothetical protein
MTDPTTAAPAPKMVKMPRARHELVTGPKPDQKIDAGEMITDELATKHKLSDKTLASLVETGAVELVDVLKG